MTRWASEPEAAANALITGALDEIAPASPILLAEASPQLAASPALASLATVPWHRRIGSSGAAQPAPPAGPFATAFLRMPKSRDEQRMAVHQCLGVLAPDGRLIVYGGNDEGIRSFQKSLM